MRQGEEQTGSAETGEMDVVKKCTRCSRGIDRMLSTMGYGWFDYCIFCNTDHPSKYYPALYYTRATEDIELQYINEKCATEDERSKLVKQFSGKYGNRTYYLVSYSQSKNVLLYMDGQIQAPDIIYYAQLSAYRNIYSSYGEDWKSSFLAGSVHISPVERVGVPEYVYYDSASEDAISPFMSLTKAFQSEERGCINYRILRPSIKVAEMVAFPTRSVVFMLEGGLVDYVSYVTNETDFDAQKALLAKDIGFSVAQRKGHTLLKTNLDLPGKYPEYFIVPFNDRNVINIEAVRFGGSKVIAVIEGLGSFSMTSSTLYQLQTTIKQTEGIDSCYCKNNCLYYIKRKIGTLLECTTANNSPVDSNGASLYSAAFMFGMYLFFLSASSRVGSTVVRVPSGDTLGRGLNLKLLPMATLQLSNVPLVALKNVSQ